MPSCVIGASVPPTIIASQRLSRMYEAASPIAIDEAAQAVQEAAAGPRVPSSIEIMPDAMFGISIVIHIGLMRSAPLRNRCSSATCSVCSPPMPVATEVPMRCGSGWAGCRGSASAQASRAAATAICTKRSVRRAVGGRARPRDRSP